LDLSVGDLGDRSAGRSLDLSVADLRDGSTGGRLNAPEVVTVLGVLWVMTAVPLDWLGTPAEARVVGAWICPSVIWVIGAPVGAWICPSLI
jgi:hypothetical protein